MGDQLNGAEPIKPTINLVWDEEAQAVSVNCTGFKNGAFIRAVLDMAGRAIEHMEKVKQMQAMMMREQQEQHAQALARKIIRP